MPRPSSTRSAGTPTLTPTTTASRCPLTRGRIEQLHHRRCDLPDTNLDRVFDSYSDTITT
jgi:hypothetical protein